ncbi:hypothetical protein QI633_18295 [Nocardioides sp. QY071]|nr:hypothetical protein [Nocardioides sp. QY071]WGY00487.1 hypothetical protein QI633_18295 [Nocardioides sp. QY071]
MSEAHVDPDRVAPEQRIDVVPVEVEGRLGERARAEQAITDAEP